MTNSMQVSWDNSERTIIRYTYQNDWNWDDYLDKLLIGRRMMQEVDHQVCVLNDMRQIQQLPPNFLSTARSIISSRPDNTGLCILLTTNIYFKAMYRVLAQILEIVPTQYILVKTEKDAYREIKAWYIEQEALT